MVSDTVKSYVGLAVSVGTLTRARAVAAAKSLASSGEATAEQVSSIADDLLATSKANREAVAGLVRVEVERALGRLGLATAEDVRALTARLAAVEGAARSGSGSSDAKKATTAPAAKKATAAPAAKKAPAKKTAPRNAAPKGSPRKSATKKTATTSSAPGAAS